MDAIDKLLQATLAVLDHGLDTRSGDIPELGLLKSHIDGPLPRRKTEAAGLERLGGHLPD